MNSYPSSLRHPTQEPPRALLLRFGEYLLRRPDLGNLAVVQERNPCSDFTLAFGLQQIEDALLRRGPENVAAVFLEPITGSVAQLSKRMTSPRALTIGS